jgi:hypothetical protein
MDQDTKILTLVKNWVGFKILRKPAVMFLFYLFIYLFKIHEENYIKTRKEKKYKAWQPKVKTMNESIR